VSVGLVSIEEVSASLVVLLVLGSEEVDPVLIVTVLDTKVSVLTGILVVSLISVGSEVAVSRLVDPLPDVGGEATTVLVLTVNGSPHVDDGAIDGEAMEVTASVDGEETELGASVDSAAGVETSTVNGSPHVLVCAEEMPRRERNTVVRSEDCFILSFEAMVVQN
jgi:hypothetical protein